MRERATRRVAGPAVDLLKTALSGRGTREVNAREVPIELRRLVVRTTKRLRLIRQNRKLIAPSFPALGVRIASGGAGEPYPSRQYGWTSRRPQELGRECAEPIESQKKRFAC